MPDRIVVDVEIAKTIEELPGGWEDTHSMGVSCGGVYEENTDRLIIYGPDEVPDLQQRILDSTEVIGYNVLRFDLPVIFGVSRADWALKDEDRPQFGGYRPREIDWAHRTNDLLLRIWRELGYDDATFTKAHKGWGLDAVCRGTLNRRKVGWSGNAPKMFQSGKFAQLHTYCLDDVVLERDLERFIARYGYVVNGDSGQVVRFGNHCSMASRKP